MPVYLDSRTGHAYFRKQVRLPDGTSVRISGVPRDYGQPDNKRGAKEAERLAIERLLASGSTAAPAPPPPPVLVPTVAEYLPKWLAEAETSNAEATLHFKRGAAKNYILPTFGHRRLDEITFTHVNEWRQQLVSPPLDPATGQPARNPLQPASVARLLNTFHAFLSFAVANDVVDRLPKKWPRQEVPEKEQRFLSFDETDRLLAAPAPASPKPWTAWKWRVYHAMVIVAARTGLRHGELTGLRWKNVDLDRGVLWVRESISRTGKRKSPKGKKHREVPLSNDAMRALRSIRQDRWEPVFTVDGSILMPHQTDEALRLLCRAAGILPIGWHTLRHTFASHMVMRGVAISTVQAYMGHANIRDTQRYSHLSPEIKREAVMLLDQPAPTAGRAPRSRRTA